MARSKQDRRRQGDEYEKHHRDHRDHRSDVRRKLTEINADNYDELDDEFLDDVQTSEKLSR